MALNRYNVFESANVKVCQYQVMIRNGLFEETNGQNIFCLKYFTINYILNLLYVCIKSSMKNPFDALNSVTKSTSTILLVINIGRYEV